MIFNILQWIGHLFNRPISGQLPPVVEKEITPKIKLNMNEPWTHAKRKKVIKAVAKAQQLKNRDSDAEQ